jgi:hypothetical protein
VNAWEQYKKNLGDTRPWDLIGPNVEWAKKEDAENRLSTCNECPELIQLTKTCKKCGCFMTAKTKLLKATCPLGKW